MGFFKDFLKEVADSATGGSISMMEAQQDLEKYEKFKKDIENFNKWFSKNSGNYTNLLDSLNHYRYEVDGRIYHSNWLTGKQKNAYILTGDEQSENNRRKNLIENAIAARSPGYMKKLFKEYLSDTENRILDSYSVFCLFQIEMSYLPAFQKEILDSVYLDEMKELLGASGQETALTKISNLTWQIERHKTPAGHAIVLLLLAKQVYHETDGYAGNIKSQIENGLSKAEDIIINNTYRTYLPEDADALNVEALLQTGKDSFLDGEPEKAFAYFLFAAKGGSAEAKYRTGLCFEKGYGVYKNVEKAVNWYQDSAKSNLAVSKYYLAWVYQKLLAEDKCDYRKAMALYREAFDEGVADAADNIGWMYANGQGVEKDDADAVAWYEKGAAAGSPSSMFHLYKAYLNGNGVEPDHETAGQWFEKCVRFFDAPNDSEQSIAEDSAEQKEVEIEFHGDFLLPGCDNLFESIAIEFYDGNSIVSKNMDRAIEWLKKGTAVGSANSLDWLSQLYEERCWYSDSIKCARRGAEYGNLPCMNRIGMSYCNGKGVDRDKVIANMWFLRAAKGGFVLGQRNIAFEFLSGKTGLPQNTDEACRWLSLAALQGNEDAKTKLDELDEQEKEKRKEEMEKERKKLIKEKNNLLSQIKGVEKKIQSAESPQEEDSLLEEKATLNKKLAAIEDEIAKYQ